MTLPTEGVAGYDVLAVEAPRVVSSVMEWLRGERRSCQWLACINPHSFAVARANAPFRQALANCHWLVADGIGIVLASRLFGGRIRARVTGSDIFEGVSEGLNQISGRVFFLGASDATLAKIVERYSRDWPNVVIAGTYSPPYRAVFSYDENEEMIRRINGSAADVLWVAMTAPKQELWLDANASRIDVGFAAAIGAVFDFYAGQITRSHPLFQQLGLEWLPRLLQEPRRLWRRMFISAPIFVFAVLMARLSQPRARDVE